MTPSIYFQCQKCDYNFDIDTAKQKQIIIYDIEGNQLDDYNQHCTLVCPICLGHPDKIYIRDVETTETDTP